MTRDEIDVIVRVRMSVHTGGLWEKAYPGLVPTKPEEWAPTSDPGYTLPSAEEVARRDLPGTVLCSTDKISFWEWIRGDYGRGIAKVTDVISVETISSAYLSGE